MTDVGHLLCGQATNDGIAKSALTQICKSINAFANRAVRYLNEDLSEDALVFGPFCARVLLENSCAALLGRLDTFRISYLSAFQAQPEYALGKRAKSAFSWDGDVTPDERPPPELWSVDHNLPKISRALFSKHLDHIYWRPAVEKMLDFIQEHNNDALLNDLLEINPEKYMEGNKGKSSQLYSTLSKGVHWEFFSSAFLFDENTLKTTIRETCLLVSHLGLTSHFIPTAYASLSPEDAVQAYLGFRKGIS
jgi:hypothetical protein